MTNVVGNDGKCRSRSSWGMTILRFMIIFGPKQMWHTIPSLVATPSSFMGSNVMDKFWRQTWNAQHSSVLKMDHVVHAYSSKRSTMLDEMITLNFFFFLFSS
jgi:hypothetical protein